MTCWYSDAIGDRALILLAFKFDRAEVTLTSGKSVFREPFKALTSSSHPPSDVYGPLTCSCHRQHFYRQLTLLSVLDSGRLDPSCRFAHTGDDAQVHDLRHPLYWKQRLAHTMQCLEHIQPSFGLAVSSAQQL